MDKFGVILVKKPVGITSFDVVRKLRRVLHIKQIGHTGTLDPFAEGLMQILIGKATKIAQYLTAKDKRYHVTMKFGVKTDTGDNTGAVIEESAIEKIELNESELRANVEALTEQTPPKYSAIKIDGVRAYKLARNDVEFEMQARPIRITDFTFIIYDFPFFTYECTVSKGTYIRTVSEQIASLYKTIATTTALKRLTVADIKIEDAVELDSITEDNWEDYLLPIDRFLDVPVYLLTEEQNEDYWHGRTIVFDTPEDDCELAVIKYQDKVVGLAKVSNNKIVPKKVFK